MIKVLFVCMGNICRSPTAHAVFEQLVEQKGLADSFQIDSAGTHSYHEGMTPDLRSMQALTDRGIDMSHLKARIVMDADFEHFDYIVAMDDSNLSHLIDMAPQNHHHKISLLLEHDDALDEREVPDPYYGGLNGFNKVIDLVEAGAKALLSSIVNERRLNKAPGAQ